MDKISILVPCTISSFDKQRAENWRWLEAYWKSNLPDSEVVVGVDKRGTPFSKSVAVNDAVRKSTGDILVIIDADSYLAVPSVLRCAREIRMAEERGWKLWYVPYRNLYRLTEQASRVILDSDPESPPPFPHAPPESDIMNTALYQGTPVSRIGHWYGAMAQIMSREAFETVGGWDERMRGWGGEDHAAMVAMDTLYAPHKSLPDTIAHIWHPVMHPENVDDRAGKRRLWNNQEATKTNDALSGRYYWSKGNPERMRRLVDEFRNKIEPVTKHHTSF